MIAFPSALVANVTHTIAGRTVITLQSHLSPEQRDEALAMVQSEYPPEGYGASLDGSTIRIWSAD